MQRSKIHELTEFYFNTLAGVRSRLPEKEDLEMELFMSILKRVEQEQKSLTEDAMSLFDEVRELDYKSWENWILNRLEISSQENTPM